MISQRRLQSLNRIDIFAKERDNTVGEGKDQDLICMVIFAFSLVELSLWVCLRLLARVWAFSTSIVKLEGNQPH